MRKQRRNGALALTILLTICLSGCGSVSKAGYGSLEESCAQLEEAVERINDDYEEMVEKYDDLKESYSALLKEKESWEAAQAAGNTGTGAGSNAAGITYEQLVRYADDCYGQYVTFSGQVIYLSQEEDSLLFILAENGDLYRMICCYASPDWLEAGLSEGAYVTIYGQAGGLTEYTPEMLYEYIQYRREETAAPTAAETEPETTVPETAETRTAESQTSAPQNTAGGSPQETAADASSYYVPIVYVENITG